jgi:hypothetical protein
MLNDQKRPPIQIALTDHITMHFRWHHALYHPQWESHVFPTQNEYDNILKMALRLERVRKVFKRDITVLSWLRRPKYNKMIGGAKHSAHINGLAVDFIVDGMKAHDTRLQLIPHLETLKIRMEKLDPNQHWVHIDLKEPGITGRYFVP